MFRLVTAGIWENDKVNCKVCGKSHLKDKTYWYEFCSAGMHCSKRCLVVTILGDIGCFIFAAIIVAMICLSALANGWG